MNDREVCRLAQGLHSSQGLVVAARLSPGQPTKDQRRQIPSILEFLGLAPSAVQNILVLEYILHFYIISNKEKIKIIIITTVSI